MARFGTFFGLVASVALFTGCSKNGAATIFDSVLGQGSVPALSSFSTQVVTQGSNLKLDFNNVQKGGEGSDEDMTYACFYDDVVDGVVAEVQSCDLLPQANISFGARDGIFQTSPSLTLLGNYEVKVTGRNNRGLGFSVFVLSVRLKFSGIQSISAITGNSAKLEWISHPQALGYQVKLLNESTGLYEVVKTITGSASRETVLTGLQPNKGYSARIEATDALGNLDGNVVTQSFTTTELVRFDLSVASTTVPAGLPVTITIRAKNSNNTPQTIGGIPLTASLEGGTATGVFGAVNDLNNGTYTVQFTPELVGTPVTVALTTILNFNIDTPITFTVLPGAPAASTSNLNVSASVVSADSTLQVTAVVKDSYGNNISSGRAVTFVASGGTSSGTFGAVTNAGDGSYTALFKGVTAGTATSIRLYVDGVALGSISQSVTVVPGTPVSSTSTIAAASSSISAGASTTVTATLRDIYSNLVSSGVVVTFNKSGGTSTGDFAGSVTNAGSGVYTTTYTGNAAGTAQTISVSVNGVALTPTTAITVVAGAPTGATSHMTISNSTVTSGSGVVITATLRDANSNPIVAGTVSFDKSGGTSTGTFSAVTNSGNGVYNIQYTGVAAGTAQSIRVLHNGTQVGTLTVSIQVTPGSPVLSNSTLTLSSASVVSGNGVTVTSVIRDSNNNPIPSGISVGFTKTGGSSTGVFGSVTNDGSGQYSTTYTGVVAGSAQTINLIVDGFPLGLTRTVTVNPGPPSASNSTLSLSSATVISGSTVTLRTTIRDENNNPIVSGLTVAFDAVAGNSTGTISATTNEGAGVYSAVFTGVVSGTAKSVNANINGSAFGNSLSLQVLTGPASLANSTFAVSSATVISGQNISVTAVVKDLNNNPVVSGVAVGFSKAGGTSTGSFGTVTNDGAGQYSTTYTGILAGTAQTLSLLIDGTTLGLTQTVSVLTGPASTTTSTLIITSTNVVAGSAVTVRATLKDENNNPLATGITVAFDAAGGTSTGTFSAVTNEGAGVYSATFTGIVAGTAKTIRTTINGTAFGSSVSIQVQTGPAAVGASTLAISSTTVNSGQAVTLTAVVRDAYNNPVTSGVSVGFTKTGGTSTGTFSSVVNEGSGQYTTTYTGLAAGTAQTINLTVDGSPLGLTRSVTVIPGPPSASFSTITVSSSTVVAGNSVTVRTSIRDANNNAISAGILVSFDAMGGTSTGTFSSVTNEGAGSYAATFTGNIAGTAKSLNANINGAAFGNSVSLQVMIGPASASMSTIAVGAPTVRSHESTVVTATLKDSQGNAINSGVTVSFTKTGGTSTGAYDGTVATGSGGVYTTNYTGVAAGTSQTLSLNIEGSPLAISTFLSVVPGTPVASNSSITVSSPTVAVNNSVTVTGTLRDFNSNLIPSGVTVGFSKAGGTSTGNLSAVTNVGNGTYIATYTGATKGTSQTLSLLVEGSAFGPTVPVTVTAGPPHHIRVTASPTLTENLKCEGPYTLTVEDSSNVPTSSSTPIVLTFSSTGSHEQGTLFSNDSCTTSLTSSSTSVTATQVPALTEKIDFYYMSSAPKNFALSISPSLSPLTTITQNIVNTPVLAWIGAGAPFSATASTTGTPPAAIVASDTNGFVEPYDVSIEGSTVYVTDVWANRIIRMNGSLQITGWLGLVASTEGMVCESGTPAVGQFTPSWCTGGKPNSTTASLLTNPRAITVGPSYIYITQGHYVMRFAKSTGVYGGWVGWNNASTTTCGAVSSAVSSWCTAQGTASAIAGLANSSLGGFNGPLGLRYFRIDSVDYLFVADSGNNRIVKLNMDGSSAGWIGNIGATAPTTPAACNGTTQGQPTPGWCTNGVAQKSTRIYLSGTPPTIPGEGFNNNQSMEIEHNGTNTTELSGNYLYVADTSNARIVRIDARTGAFNGWVGFVTNESASTISGGTTTNNYPSTWITGGATNATSGSRGWGSILKVRSDGTYIYATDSYHRVTRIKRSDGQGLVWLGRVGTTPSGGISGCASSPVGSSTPGWCSGGASDRYGTSNMAFHEARSLDLLGTDMIVTDRYNYRLQRIKTDGTFVSWVGGVRSVADGWRKDAVAPARGGFDDYSFAYSTSGAVNGITVSPSGALLAADFAWHRIKKFKSGAGSYQGYIGTFSGNNPYSPVAPEDCVGVTTGMTPTWCYGGGRTSATSGVNGYSSPAGVTSDSQYIYIANSGNNRIDKVLISDASYIGWIGRIASQPNDGPDNCAGTASPNQTPNWCIGGNGDGTSAHGSFDSTRAIYYDSLSSTLFGSDNRRIYKIDPDNGAVLGAVGSVSAGTGCTVTGSAAAGWCTATTGAAVSNAYGRLNIPQAIAADSTYFYVADIYHRIQRFKKSDGAPSGFIGTVNAMGNLANADGCTDSAWISKAVPKVTPGWCRANVLGQSVTLTASALEGGLNDPRGVYVANGFLYVLDTGNNRINKYDAASGAFQGWKGYVTTTPTGGEAGCTGFTPGTVTKAWCTGGAAGNSSMLGGFDTPTGMTGDAFYLYVFDPRNNRIQAVPR